MQPKLPDGFKIGHADDDATGVTVIICEKGAVAGADVRGGAPATHETDLLRPEKMMKKINAVCLCGGSAYGLGAIAGVMEALREKKIGYKIGAKVVPIVCGASIFDLNGKDYRYPDKKFGYDAAVSASDNNISRGKIGAGKGATVGKIRGVKNSSPSGLGIASVKVCGCILTAVVCVNALGDVYDCDTNEIIAGAKDKNGNFLNTEKAILDNNYLRLILGSNTTVGCLITDAKLSKTEANKLASICHNGLARVIRPVHTDYDGDALFCMSSNKKPSVDFVLLEVGAVEAVSRAVNDAVRI
jgi:L-aminopeptidase/D-esterase-like protein